MSLIGYKPTPVDLKSMSGIHPEADVRMRCPLFAGLRPELGEEQTWNCRRRTPASDPKPTL